MMQRLFLSELARIFVIPAKAGIQRSGVNAVRLDSGFRRNDGVLANMSTDCLIRNDCPAPVPTRNIFGTIIGVGLLLPNL